MGQNDLYKKLKHFLPPIKSAKYLKWMHEKFPRKELHHILGAAGTAIKSTDFLVVPVIPEDHARMQKNLHDNFDELLSQALWHLLLYVHNLEKNRTKSIETDINPQGWQ